MREVEAVGLRGWGWKAGGARLGAGGGRLGDGRVRDLWLGWWYRGLAGLYTSPNERG